LKTVAKNRKTVPTKMTFLKNEDLKPLFNQPPKKKESLMGFDPKNIVEQGIDKAKNLVNDKAGKEVVNDEHTSKAEEVVNENVQKITDKFGK